MNDSSISKAIFHKGSSNGILMLHGLTASPNDFKEFAEKFTGLKYTVSAPVLSGHGTKVQDLDQAYWYDWFSDTKEAYYKLRKHCKRIVVIGQSMGGTLALHLAAHYQIEGLVLLAPGLVFRNKASAAIKFISKFKKYLDKIDGPDIKNDFSRKKALSYMQMSTHSIEETARLFHHVRQDLPEVHSPLLIFHSVNDHVIDYKSSELIYKKISSKNKRLITLYDSFHVLSLDNEKNVILNEILVFIKNIFSK
jgi:carboxylesterase